LGRVGSGRVGSGRIGSGRVVSAARRPPPACPPPAARRPPPARPRHPPAARCPTSRGKCTRDSTTIPSHGSVDRQNIVTPERRCPKPCSPEFQCWHGQEWSDKTTKYCDPSAPTLLGLNIEIRGNGGEAEWPRALGGHSISSIYRTHLVGQWSLSKAARWNAKYCPQIWTREPRGPFKRTPGSLKRTPGSFKGPRGLSKRTPRSFEKTPGSLKKTSGSF